MSKKKAKKAKARKTTKVKKIKEMASEPKKVSGRKPVLLPFIESAASPEPPFKIYATYKEKEYSAMVLTSGFIRYEETDYATPSAAGRAVLGNNKDGKPLQVDGWNLWEYNQDGKRVKLDTLRGKDSPLQKEKEAAA